MVSTTINTVSNLTRQTIIVDDTCQQIVSSFIALVGHFVSQISNVAISLCK